MVLVQMSGSFPAQAICLKMHTEILDYQKLCTLLQTGYWDVISKLTCGDFSLLDLVTMRILSPNILYRRTVEVNLCWSPGSIHIH